MLNIYDNN